MGIGASAARGLSRGYQVGDIGDPLVAAGYPLPYPRKIKKPRTGCPKKSWKNQKTCLSCTKIPAKTKKTACPTSLSNYQKGRPKNLLSNLRKHIDKTKVSVYNKAMKNVRGQFVDDGRNAARLFA